MIISWFKFQLYNLRFYIILSTIFISISLITFIRSTSDTSAIADIRITEYFGLLSVLYLYLALLASPLAILLPKLPYKSKFVHSRRAIGVSAFIFAYFHSNTAFFSLLNGFNGLQFLAPNYLFAVALGTISITILFAMAATSFDLAIKILTAKWWKRLQRLVYFVVFAILIHATLLGSHFNNPNSPIPYIYNSLLCLVLISHALVIEKRNSTMRKYHLPLISALVAILMIFIYYFIY